MPGFLCVKIAWVFYFEDYIVYISQFRNNQKMFVNDRFSYCISLTDSGFTANQEREKFLFSQNKLKSQKLTCEEIKDHFINNLSENCR